jgi:FkbM family methyltransferase
MRLRTWYAETTRLLRESCGPLDFMRLMQARLSLSRVGKLVAPRPKTLRINTTSMGRQLVIRSHTTDIAIFGEMANRAYGHLPLWPDVSTVVDLGANIGLAARWLSVRYPVARIVCVEPEPGNVEILRENVRELDATVIEACVGGRERHVGLVTDGGEYGYRIGDEGGRIPVVTMRTVLEQAAFDGRPLDIVKCDIEGAEAELLDDCRAWIHHVRALVIECHAPYSASDLAVDLARNGGRFRTLHVEQNDAYGTETATLVRF